MARKSGALLLHVGDGTEESLGSEPDSLVAVVGERVSADFAEHEESEGGRKGRKKLTLTKAFQ
jgi:hypothetical protein